MTMKRYLFVVVVVLMAGCGDNPAAPSAPAPAPDVKRIEAVQIGPFDCSKVRWIRAGCGCKDNKIVCVDNGPIVGPEVEK
jgi:hypothetical protein